MSYNILEENLREAACIGDLETVQNLVRQNINVNCKNSINGWTPLHWACKRGHEQIVKFLLTHGADKTITNQKGESPITVSANNSILALLCEVPKNFTQSDPKFVPNYISHPPLNGHIDYNFKHRPRFDLLSTKIENIPNNEDVVLRVRVANNEDPDYIEIELPEAKTYSSLLKLCCQELSVEETKVERIRKLPNIRIRNDNDVKRLKDSQYLELVLHSNFKNDQKSYPYPLISSCNNQTILY